MWRWNMRFCSRYWESTNAESALSLADAGRPRSCGAGYRARFRRPLADHPALLRLPVRQRCQHTAIDRVPESAAHHGRPVRTDGGELGCVALPAGIPLSRAWSPADQTGDLCRPAGLVSAGQRNLGLLRPVAACLPECSGSPVDRHSTDSPAAPRTYKRGSTTAAPFTPAAPANSTDRRQRLYRQPIGQCVEPSRARGAGADPQPGQGAQHPRAHHLPHQS